MGFIKNIKDYLKWRSVQNTADTSNTSKDDDALIEALIAGREITRDMAMTIPVVSSCVNLISDTIASVPFRLYHRIEEDDRIKTEEITDDRRTVLINVDTGDTLTGFEYKKALIADYLLGRGGYAYINRSGNEIISLHHVDDKQISVMKNSDPIFKAYSIQINGRMYDDYQIFRLLRSTSDGSTGKPLIKEISKAIETAYSALLYELHITQTGGVKKGFLQSPGQLKDEVKKEIKAAWKRLYSGENSESVVLLSNGITFQEANQTPLDLQLAQIRADMNKEIKAAFGVEDDREKFLEDTIKPIIAAFENAMDVFFLLEKEKTTHYFKADIRQLQKAKSTTAISINEARYRESLPTVPGLDIIPLSLGTTFVDANTGKIFVPNTGDRFNPDGSSAGDGKGGEEE